MLIYHRCYNFLAMNSVSHSSSPVVKAVSSESPVTTLSLIRQSLSFEEMVPILEQRIQHLLSYEDFTTEDVTSDLKFVQRQTRYSCDTALHHRIVDRIVRAGFAHIYLRVWQSVSTINYFDDDNDVAFTNLQLVLSIIWNCSDKSVSLCDSLARAAVVNQMLSELANVQLSEADLSINPDKLYLVKAYLGILHNMVRLCVDSRRIFRSAGAVNVLQIYLRRPQGLVRTKAYLVLAYIVDERENEIINATDENIAYIIEILRSALESENHFTQLYAFWATEVVCGLNHLAINDANKARLGNLGAVRLYLMLLKDGSTEERGLAAAGLWIMSFCADNRRIMVHEPGCIEALQQAATNTSEEGISRSARGALWVIRSTSIADRPSSACSVESMSSSTTSTTSEVDIPHVMISYQWGSQATMLVVKERLKAEGFKVWMDVDNMSGSTLEAMALAVERSAVILVCMSQGYKDSPSCRTEAEYMYRLRKDIIPLVLQSGYSPDGWLGILVGTRLYFDLSCPTSFEHELTRLVSEIGDRGRLTPSLSRCTSSASLSTPPPRSVVDSPVPHEISLHQVMHNYSEVALPRATSWSRADVQMWLATLKLSQVALQRLSELDGPLLLQYKKMMQTAPQFFYQSLESQFGLTIIDVLSFTKGLETLK